MNVAGVVSTSTTVIDASFSRARTPSRLFASSSTSSSSSDCLPIVYPVLSSSSSSQQRIVVRAVSSRHDVRGGGGVRTTCALSGRDFPGSCSTTAPDASLGLSIVVKSIYDCGIGSSSSRARGAAARLSSVRARAASAAAAARGEEAGGDGDEGAGAGGAGDGGGGGTAPSSSSASSSSSPLKDAIGFLKANYFLLGMLGCIAAASAAPWLGCTGGPLRPELTVNQIAIRAMFLISGLNLPLAKLREAVTNMRANALIQAFIFGVAGAAVAFVIGPALKAAGILTPRLVDGLVVLACLPTTIGSGVALTQSADGNVAVSLFHAVFSNLAGIAITPALIFAYLGTSAGGVSSPTAAAAKLVSTVLVPVVTGMAIRALPGVGERLGSKGVKSKLKLTSDVIILAIIYNTFCNTFKSGFGVAMAEVTALGAVLTGLLVAYKAAIFFCAGAVGLSNRDTVAAVFMGSQKTLAFGLPLIKALFEGSPDLVWFCLPALVYHPMQIALGSALVPRLREFAAKDDDGKTN